MKKYRFLFLLVLLLLVSQDLYAEGVVLRDGKTITGRIVEVSRLEVVLNTSDRGLVTVPREFIRRMEGPDLSQPVSDSAPAGPETIARAEATPPAAQPEAVQPTTQQILAKKTVDDLQRKISLGYSQTRGNTEASQFVGELKINYKTGQSEHTGRVTSFLSSSDKKMDALKFYGLLRTARSFGKALKAYRFCKLEGTQDRFANIDFRLTPSAGFGYWFADQEDLRVLAEIAAGYEYTNYQDDEDSKHDGVLVPRAYLKKKIFGDASLEQDITVYPSLQETQEYRLHSETSLVNPLNDKVALKVSFLDDYDSSPLGDTKKNDYQLTTSLDIDF